MRLGSTPCATSAVAAIIHLAVGHTYRAMVRWIRKRQHAKMVIEKYVACFCLGTWAPGHRAPVWAGARSCWLRRGGTLGFYRPSSHGACSFIRAYKKRYEPRSVENGIFLNFVAARWLAELPRYLVRSWAIAVVRSAASRCFRLILFRDLVVVWVGGG